MTDDQIYELLDQAGALQYLMEITQFKQYMELFILLHQASLRQGTVQEEVPGVNVDARDREKIF